MNSPTILAKWDPLLSRERTGTDSDGYVLRGTVRAGSSFPYVPSAFARGREKFHEIRL
jgi:hypothetical protein